jgi:hypothetical protein
VTRAAVEDVEPDPGRARDFLAQAKIFLADADQPATHAESAVVLYWQTCVSAMDAILAARGRRIGPGVGSHAVRVESAAAILGAGYNELFERLDEWRRERNDVSYAAITTPAADVAAMQTDARDIVDAAAGFLDATQTR